MRTRWIISAAVAVLVALACALGGGSIARADPSLPGAGGWPLAGAPHVIRGFSPPQQRWLAGHRGVDLAAAAGSPVLSAAAGTVSFAGRVAGTEVVVVDHGGVRTTYEPVKAVVAVGQRVGLGQKIGTLGVWGHCGARSCLHWGLRAGDHYLDPLQLISGGTATGPVRLLPASAAAAADRRAVVRAARELAAERASTAGPMTPAGTHGFGLPVNGPVTSGYGMRFHPVLHVWKLHDGTDFGAACGTPIRAPYPGTVVERFFNRGYGNRLMLDHGVVGGQHVVTGYNHATAYVVAVGSRVQRGQVLGYVGQTGFATGCHLHLMTWLNGRLVNSMTWF